MIIFVSGWHYFLAFAENSVDMSDLQAYAKSIRVIKEAYYVVSIVQHLYGIGRYVSKNSREDFWGKGAIKAISQQLQKELPGLRGFSAANIKNYCCPVNIMKRFKYNISPDSRYVWFTYEPF